jgi:guanyl-specific ribonuclease Sa
LLLVVAVAAFVWMRGVQTGQYQPSTSYQPNPTNATAEQVDKAFKIATASSTLTFETVGANLHSVALTDLPPEITKFLKGINKGATYNAFSNGIYSINYRTKVSLAENHANVVRNINRDKEKLVQARSTTLASMLEIDIPEYQVRITQKVVEGGLTEVILDAKPK